MSEHTPDPIDAAGEVAAAVAGRREAEAALDASETRFRRVFEAVPVGMALVDRDARFVDVNDALATMLGYERADLVGRTFADVTPEEDARRDVELNRRMFAGEIDRYRLEKRYVTRLGRVKWGAVQAACVDTEQYAVVIVEDITARKEADARLAHLATHDELTGLPNRSMAMEGLTHALARTGRTNEHLGVPYVDVDRLKALNARLGYEHGDVVLVEIAARLQSVLRRSDTAARIGSDEFVVWCEDLGRDPDAARALAVVIGRRVSAALAVPVELGDAEVHVTASVGVVVATGPDVPLAAILREGAVAVAAAKASGGGRAVLFGGPVELDLRGSEVSPPSDPLYR